MNKFIKRSMLLVFIVLGMVFITACNDSTPEYTINFDSKGGSDVASVEVKSGDKVVEPTVNKTGYSIGGWFTSVNEGATLDKEWSFINDEVNNSMTLYAKWNINQYTVSFDSNMGSTVSDIVQDYNTSLIEPKAPTRVGYAFDGWYIDASLETEYVFQTMPGENITLYAKWAVNQYTINFEANQGSEVSNIIQDFNTSLIEPKAPTRAGYVFDGWYTDASLETEYVFQTMPGENITLYAKWAINQYTVSFEVNEGSLVEDITQDYNTSITEPQTPTKLGHTFDAWYTDSLFTSKYVFQTMPGENITLYAKWAVNQYTITFETNQGSKVLDITQDFNTSLVEPETPSKTGYTFDGWYTNASLETEYVFQTMPGENITLYAKWDKVILNESIMKETFESLQAIKDAGGNFSEYLDSYYTGDNYVFWELINARIDLGMKDGGNAITLAGKGNDITEAGMGRIYGELIHDGVKRIQFEARLPFSPNSTYPQGPGSDKASSVKIKVFINGILIETLQFADDKEANKGKIFIIDNLNIIGDFSLSIEVSSGHRLTIDNIEWETNKYGIEETEALVIDFEDNRFDFDNDETEHEIGGVVFAFKEVHTKIMHGEKELAYMDTSVHGQSVARFRGDKDDYFSTPIAYMYNVVAFDKVQKLSFDARLFGSNGYFGFDSEINIYFMDEVTREWTLLDSNFDLVENFNHYELEINKTNVQIKIEVLKGKVNIDNIIFE